MGRNIQAHQIQLYFLRRYAETRRLVRIPRLGGHCKSISDHMIHRKEQLHREGFWEERR